MASFTATAAILASAACTSPTLYYHPEPRSGVEIEADSYRQGLLNAGAITSMSRSADVDSTSFRIFLFPANRFAGLDNQPLVQRLLLQVEELRTLGPDWHGPGSAPPDAECVSAATQLIEALFADGAPRYIPAVGVDHDGEIVLSWNGDRIIGSLSILSPSRFSFYVKNKFYGRVARGASDSIRSIPGSLLMATQVM